MQPLAAEMRQSLVRDLLDPWYSRAVDPKGGFRQSYDRSWNSTDDGSRFVVFQARLTWGAATAALAFPDRRDEYLAHARHGVEFLLGPFFEEATGAVRWILDAQQRPAGVDDRRTYGTAFALYALAAAARAKAHPDALSTARQIFAHLDSIVRDRAYGGYFEGTDSRGNPLQPDGKKSHNTTLHLLEALLELWRVWPDPAVAERIGELAGILSGPFILPQGCSTEALTRDLKPATDSCSYGHDLEAAHLLMLAPEAVGPIAGLDPTVERMGRFALDHGWDRANGGFFATGKPDGSVDSRKKIWWVQAECLLGLAALSTLPEADRRFADSIAPLWRWIEERHIDAVEGGWFGTLDEHGELLDKGVKGSVWKALYHETRALLGTAAVLDRPSARWSLSHLA